MNEPQPQPAAPQRADGRPLNVLGLPRGVVELPERRWRHGVAFRKGVATTYIIGPALHYQQNGAWSEYDLRLLGLPAASDYDYGLVGGADYGFSLRTAANASGLLRLTRSGQYLELAPLGLSIRREGFADLALGIPLNVSGAVLNAASDELVQTGRYDWPSAFGPGFDLGLVPMPNRVAKQLTVPRLPVLSGNSTGWLRLTWRFATAALVYVDGQPWDGSAVTTEGLIELRNNGERLWGWRAPWVRDAAGKHCRGRLAISRDGGGFLIESEFPLDWCLAAQLPLVLDPDTYVAETADGYVYGENAVYATAHATSTASSNVGDLYVGQYAGPFGCIGAYLSFDTSGISAAEIVRLAQLYWRAVADFSATDFDVQLRKCAWTEPLGGAREAAYDARLTAELDQVWRNTSGLAINTFYASPALDNSWIGRAGDTKYVAVSDRDIAETVPAGNEFLQMTSGNSAPGTEPYLAITTTPTGVLEPWRLGWQLGIPR